MTRPTDYNVVSAGGWHDDGPVGDCRDMGSTSDPARLPGLVAEAEEALALHGWAGRVFVTDGRGELVARREWAALAAA